MATAAGSVGRMHGTHTHTHNTHGATESTIDHVLPAFATPKTNEKH